MPNRLRHLLPSLLCAGLFTFTAAGAAAPAALASCSIPSDGYSQAVQADSPAAYFRLSEPAGSVTLCDDSSAHADGTYAGGVTQFQPGALKSSTDASVTATSGVGQSGAAAGLAGNHSFTLEAWFRGASQEAVLVGTYGSSTGASAGLGVSGSGHASCQATSSAIHLDLWGGGVCWDTTAAGVDLFDGSWHHVAVTYDATSGVATGYADGALIGTRQPGVGISLANRPVLLGQWGDGFEESPLSGSLDEAAVYPTALSADRVTAHLAAAGYTAPRPVWDLQHDFAVSGAGRVNPQADSYGHAGVWSYLEQANAAAQPEDPAAFSLLPNWDACSEPSGAGFYLDSGCTSQSIGINKSGATIQTSASAYLQPGQVGMYPLSRAWVIVGWRSPINGTVRVDGLLTPLDANTGHTRSWALLKADSAGATGATTLESGQLAGTTTAGAGFGVSSSPITVSPGTMLYVLVGPGAGDDWTYDSTGLSFTVRELTATTTPANTGSGGPSPGPGPGAGAGAGSGGGQSAGGGAHPPIVQASYDQPSEPWQATSFGAAGQPRFTVGDRLHVSGSCSDGGSGVFQCEVIDTYNGKNDLVLPGSPAGRARQTIEADLTVGGPGTHLLSVWGVDGSRADAGHVQMSYTVAAPAPAATQQRQDSAALGGGSASSYDCRDGLVTRCREIVEHGKPVALVITDSIGRTASVIAVGGANVINAGGANVINAGGANVINAGGANVIAAGGANLFELVDAAGRVIAVGGANVINAGGANLISDKGLGLIGNAGGALISDQGTGLIGSASPLFLLSGSSLVPYGGDSAAQLATGPFATPGQLVGAIQSSLIAANGTPLISDKGLGLISDKGLGLISDQGTGLISDKGLGAADVASAARAATHRTVRSPRLTSVGGGSTRIAAVGQRGVLGLLFGSRVHRLLTLVGDLNARRRAHHLRLIAVPFGVTLTFKPAGRGRVVTRRRIIRVTPLRAAHR